MAKCKRCIEWMFSQTCRLTVELWDQFRFRITCQKLWLCNLPGQQCCQPSWQQEWSSCFMISLSVRWVRPWLTSGTKPLSGVCICSTEASGHDVQNRSNSIYFSCSLPSQKHKLLFAVRDVEGGVVLFPLLDLDTNLEASKPQGPNVWELPSPRGTQTGKRVPGGCLAWAGCLPGAWTCRVRDEAWRG